jgi:hypothetical protein
MVTNPRSPISDRPNLTLVPRDQKTRVKVPKALAGRIVSTVVALVLLAAVLRYLPAGPKTTQAQAGSVPVEALTEDLQLGSLQMSQAIAGEALYLDGVAKNTGAGSVTAATVEVRFHDVQGKVVSSVQKPIVGMAHGGTDLVRNEFARNPILPNEMRFFRVAIEQVPPTWNHEVPELKIVEVKAR